MPRTAAQNEASRRNGARSAGPVTVAGKSSSSRNALKHGLRATVVFPDDMARDVQREESALARDLRPGTALERRLVRQMAVADVRNRRATAAVEADTAGRVRNAFRDWDDARDAEVARWVDLLEDDPATAVANLRRTAEGCDWLCDQWDALKEAAEGPGDWDQALMARALSLMGSGPDDELIDSPPEFARRTVLGWAADAMPRLTALGDQNWERYDGPDRADAPALALCYSGKESCRLRNYELAASRLFHRSLDRFWKVRKEGVPEPRDDEFADDLPTNEPEAAAATNEPEPAPVPATNEPS